MSWLTDLLKEYPAVAVAKQRLALMQERYDAAEAINKTLADRVTQLEKENTEFRTRLEEIERKKIGALDDDSRKVLETVYLLGRENVTIVAVSRHLGMDPAKAKLLLRKLEEQDYLFDRLYTNRDREYCLNDKGTEFLIEIGVIK
jgi:predicted transcriptional regulator